ncbi:NifC-like ABC-type porter [Methanospirillum hungatei JF-1]|uniref:NifC-like ABC-type porter n=1 Tax=Methanospirillum hungatei JF-1 (strain ATCC 27890 / DSM 864 / NBRC 100397 / JF-1) TaxID=323259 RepID=Q2FNW1_METHJ|nr:ABC transporter permease [Methanospirillum hungatei]ABD41072.1 NifC-like ABC-type porter [Methanospirillum hungatei JF-1]
MSDMRNSWLRSATIGTSILLTLFIIILLLLIVTKPSPDALYASITSPEIQFAIVMSLGTSIISTFLCILIAVPAAYALARYNFFGKDAVNAILDMPLALPPLVAGLGLLLFFGTTGFGNALADMGLVFVFTPLGIIAAQFFVNFPYMLRIMRSTFESISTRYEFVAKTLGCTDAQAVWRVTLPMAGSGFFAASVITWAKGIGEFGAALLIAGAIQWKTETLPIALFLNMSCGKLNMAISAATILIIICVISLYLFERYGGASRL